MYKNILLAVVSIVLTLSLIEFIFRVNGKYATYIERTGGAGGYVSPYDVGHETWYHVLPVDSLFIFPGNEFTRIYKSNNEGLNDQNFTVAKHGLRILAIGDSFTEGVGAPTDSSYPKQLHTLLYDSFKNEIEVWNCGFCASDPVYEFRLFNDKLLKYKPDMVIVTVNTTAISNLITRGGFERFISNGKIRYKESPWFEPLYAHSFIVRRILHDYLKYNWQLLPPAMQVEASLQANTELSAVIDSFNAICSQKRVKLLCIAQPLKHEWMYRSEYELKPLITYCENKKVACIDLKTEFNEMGIDSTNAATLYWNIDGHFNCKGYNYFARAIWKKVAAQIAL